MSSLRMFLEEGKELNVSEEVLCEGEEAVNKSSKHRRNNPRKGQGQDKRARTQPKLCDIGSRE
jgi:poly(A) polymerase Pap1